VKKPFASWLEWIGSTAQSTVKQSWLGKVFSRSPRDETEPQEDSPAQRVDDPLYESGLLD
jgi:hypothetical protein